MSIKKTDSSKIMGAVVMVGLIFIISSVFYTVPSDSRLVTATTTTNGSQATLQPKAPVSVITNFPSQNFRREQSNQ